MGKRVLNRGQVSVEYLMVLGFALIIVLPLTLIFFSTAGLTKDEVNLNQARQAVRKIVDDSEKIYYYGEPAMTTLKLYMPENIINVSITTKEVSMRIRVSSGGESDISEPSSVNLTGSLSTSSGLHFIKLEVAQGAVQISTQS